MDALKKKTTCFVLALVMSLAWAPPSVADPDEGPSIDEIRLNEDGGDVLVDATLKTHFDTETREAIRGGIPLIFRFRVRLTRRGVLLGEKVIRDEELVHTLQYNPVKQMYLFRGEGYGGLVELTTKDEEEALGWLSRISGWSLYPLDKLKKGVRYRVRVMATLRSAELPSVLGYLFFFTTIFNKETPWEQVDFTY